MKKLFQTIIFAAVALFLAAWFAPVNLNHNESGAAAIACKVAIVAVLALNVLPMCSRRFGVINTTAVSNTIQPHYSKKLLGRAVQMTRLAEFAQAESIEPGSGSTSVRFYRPPQADLTATGAPALLTEGTAPTNFRDIAYTPVDATLVQLGQVAKVTDIANTVGLVKYLDTTIDLFGDEYALDMDTRLRNILIHQTTGFTKRYAQGAATFAALAAASLANAAMVPRDLLDSMTALKLARTPMINGHYVAVVPPQGTRDILNNSEFREVVRQNYADKIFKGEIGDFYGLRITEGTNPFTEDETEGTIATTFSAAGTNTTGLIYSTIVTGKGGYGTVDMKKLGGVAKKPQIIVVDKPDSGNPLNQYTIVGWKAYWVGIMLNTAWGVTLRHKTQYV
jgi:N4-gp56 family major capsid protein